MTNSNTDLTTLDLDETAHTAILDGQQAIHKIGSVLNDAFQLVNIIEGDIEDMRIQQGAESIVARMRNTVIELAESVQHNAALIAALTIGLKSAVAQRDQAIDAQVAVENDWLDNIAENNNFTHDDAEKFLTLLLNPDSELLESDTVADHYHLSEVRESLQAFMADVDQLIE